MAHLGIQARCKARLCLEMLQRVELVVPGWSAYYVPKHDQVVSSLDKMGSSEPFAFSRRRLSRQLTGVGAVYGHPGL